MGNTVIEMIEEVKQLVEHRDLDTADDAEEFLEYLLYLIKDSIKWHKASNYLIDSGACLPFDVILKLNEITGLYSSEEIEVEWGAPGFNDWYKETYGSTVEEASGEEGA